MRKPPRHLGEADRRLEWGGTDGDRGGGAARHRQPAGGLAMRGSVRVRGPMRVGRGCGMMMVMRVDRGCRARTRAGVGRHGALRRRGLAEAEDEQDEQSRDSSHGDEMVSTCR